MNPNIFVNRLFCFMSYTNISSSQPYFESVSAIPLVVAGHSLGSIFGDLKLYAKPATQARMYFPEKCLSILADDSSTPLETFLVACIGSYFA